MDWAPIFNALIGIIGAVAGSFLTNWQNSKNLAEQRKNELEKQKMQYEYQMKSEILNTEFNKLIISFTDYSAKAYKLRYSGKYFRDEHYEYLDAYNAVSTSAIDPYTLQCIDAVHSYLLIHKKTDINEDKTFDELISDLNSAFREEIQRYKEQLTHM